jgi:beta-mannanase
MALRDQAVFGSYVSGETVRQLETKLAAPLRVVNQFFAWGEDFSSFLTSVGRRVPLVTLEPWNYSLHQIASGATDTWLNDIVSTAKSYNEPIYIRPMHEMNGDWYPWAVKPGREAAFMSAWSHMAGILRRAPNIRLVWCPNADTVNAQSPDRYYPGASVVDVLGIDGYSWDPGGTTFDSVFSRMYSLVTRLDSKDVWICETACAEGSKKPSWVTAMFASTKYPRIKALVWFSANKEQDWRIDSSSRSLMAFRSAL